MLEDLKLGPRYAGMLFLAESTRNPPRIKSHHHVELELNVVLRGAITYVVDGRSFRFEKRTLLWLFPAQEHQLVDRSVDAQNYVAVFKPRMIVEAARESIYETLRSDGAQLNGVMHTQTELCIRGWNPGHLISCAKRWTP